MGKFLLLWEVDTTKVSDNPEVRYENWTMMCKMVKKEMGSGIVDWGMFAGRLQFVKVLNRRLPCKLQGTFRK